MKILAFDNVKEDIIPSQMRAEAKEGLKRAWQLMKQGLLREIYSRKDKAGVVLIFELDTVEEAKRITDEFPLVRKGYTSYSFMALGNFDAFEVLFATQ